MALDDKIVIVLVGLPARGKSYISRKLTRYLNWIGIRTKVFNAGDYRRKATVNSGHDFFDQNNATAAMIRMQAAEDALEHLKNWLNGCGQIALFDATNTTRQRRQMVYDHCQRNNFKPIFIESICDDHNVIESSVKAVKVNGPDYVGVDKDIALRDFLERIKKYEAIYEPIDDNVDKSLSYIKIFNQGQSYFANRIAGSVSCRILHFLMNTVVSNRKIYIVGLDGTDDKVFPASKLSRGCELFVQNLGKFIEKEGTEDLAVWTSHAQCTTQVSEYIKCTRLEHLRALDEVHDSYEDTIARLEPVILELEHEQNVLIICHNAVAQCLLSYFRDDPKDDLANQEIFLETVYKIRPTVYGYDVETFKIDVDPGNGHKRKAAATLEFTATSPKKRCQSVS